MEITPEFNPLRLPFDPRINRIAGPSALVTLGVTGDLSRKKLPPATYDLANRGLLPPGFVLVGFTRRDSDDQDGPTGAGHYAMMVQNGIEYATMQAYGEGFELLTAKSDLITDVTGTFAAWQRGTVVRFWLLELLEHDPALADVSGYVEDYGEGRWTLEEAIALDVPMPAISSSIFARFVSRQPDSPTMKAVATLRNQFGGHAVRKRTEPLHTERREGLAKLPGPLFVVLS